MAPWKADIYVEGKRVCSASLFGPDLLITHRQCAEALMPDEDSSIPALYSVARLGNYHDLSEFNFLAGHEQVSFSAILTLISLTRFFGKILFYFLQVVRISGSFVPSDSVKQIALLRLEKPVNLTEYVHLICLPSTQWIPEDSNCFMHGPQEGVFNHAIETTLQGVCDSYTDSNGNSGFRLCSKQETPTDECLDNWSGTLVCPDATGKLYAVGVYHSGPGNCDDGTGADIPEFFNEIVTDQAREIIIDLMEKADTEVEQLDDDACDSGEGFLRCPLGTCLIPDQVISTSKFTLAVFL